jgi:single-stranded DNA-binding protein
MPYVANISLIGVIGADAETKPVAGGTVLEFRVAHNSGKRDDPKTVTTWYRVSYWISERQAWLVERCKKGSHVCVVGEIVARPYTSNGVERLSLDIRATNVAPFETARADAASAPKKDLGWGDTTTRSDDVPF